LGTDTELLRLYIYTKCARSSFPDSIQAAYAIETLEDGHKLPGNTGSV
jgi:hypothetical protein